MHCALPGDHHSLGLTRIQFHSLKVTPLTNPTKITAQGLCYCNAYVLSWQCFRVQRFERSVEVLCMLFKIKGTQ